MLRRLGLAPLAGLALVSAFAAVAAASTAPPRKWALLVGVTEMQKAPRAQWLSGPANDLPAMSQMLRERFGIPSQNQRLLSRSGATKAAVQSAFAELRRQVQPGDLVVFYYSGHGTQLPDQNRDEADGKDEALCPYDSGGTIASYITDDELGAWVKALPSRDVVVILDSCHSGTGLRGGGPIPRALDAATLGVTMPAVAAGAVERADNLGSDLTGPTVITGCAASETSADAPFLLRTEADAERFKAQKEKDPYFGSRADNPYHGALTYFLMRAVNLVGGSLKSYAELHQVVLGAIKKSGFEQTPQLEGYVQRPPFGGPGSAPSASPAAPAPAPAPVTGPSLPAERVAAHITGVAEGRATLEAAPGRTLANGSVFETAGARAVLRLDTVQGRQGSAAIVQGAPSAGEALAETFRPFDLERLRVAVTGNAPAAERKALSDLLAMLPTVTLVPPDTLREVELELNADPTGVRLTPYRNQQSLPPLVGASVAALRASVTQSLEALYLVAQLTALENPQADLRVDLRVNGKTYDTARIGAEVAFTARAAQDCYLYLVDVDPVGRVTVLFPNKHARANQLRAGEVTVLPAPDLFRLRVAGPAGTEVLKAIVSRKPLQLEAISAANGELAAIGEGAGFARTLLQQLRREINRNSERSPAAGGAAGLATDGWATDTLLLKITP